MTTSTHDRRPGLGTAAPPVISPGLGALAALTAVALVASAYLHLQLAANYAPNAVAGGTSEGDMFHIQALASVAAAAGLMIAVMADHRWLGPALLAAAGLLAGSLTAVVAYRYFDIGKILILPDMYEPAWFRDKTLSAIIEAAGTIAALTGARTAWRYTCRTTS
ncbi:MAG TPA: hypothetical protein VHV82_18210 [Sporichthyaceae bacterium]|jgi:hypothetical protein|nr:hypothetical protein [Sporichthyaceae bacterium]